MTKPTNKNTRACAVLGFRSFGSLKGFLKRACALQSRLLARHIGKEVDDIERAIARPRYFNPYEAVEYGIIDRVRADRIGLGQTLPCHACGAAGAPASAALATTLHLICMSWRSCSCGHE